MDPRPSRHDATDATPSTWQIGCVSYLNAIPLIHGLNDDPECHVRVDVPARLLTDLLSHEVDLALCPVIDYFRSPLPLQFVPVGGIACNGATLTVRLFSRVPIEEITEVHADSESHTSVALLQALLRERYGISPRFLDYHAREGVVAGRLAPSPEAMLLIGDKVVTSSPLAVHYPHQLDLGEAWKAWTGLPFVFAMWMARAESPLGDLPQRLTHQLERNLPHTDELADAHCERHGWPADVARRYLSSILHYRIDEPDLEAVRKFGKMAASESASAGEPLRIWQPRPGPVE